VKLTIIKTVSVMGKAGTVGDLKKIKKSVQVECNHVHSISGYDPFELDENAVGSLYQVDDDIYILAFDSELNGRKVTTTIKAAKQTLSVVRIGDVHSRHTFALNQWYASQYFYGGGSIVCRNYTKKLDYALSSEGGIIQVLYELWSNDTHLGFYNQEYFIQ
jgi:uncharacterized beta-barrel protein YwiB (DUF1934 family)